MTLVIDAAPLVALADSRDPRQEAVEQLLRAEPGDLVVPAPVTAEVDYLLGRRVGQRARRAFLDDLAAGRFVVAGLDRSDRQLVADLDRRYESLELGLADLSVVVVADRFDTPRLATFDQRHFHALRPLNGGTFTLLPN